jgi:ArsR family transcriptional regulator
MLKEPMRISDTAVLAKKARNLAAMLRLFANEHRLLILCQLVEFGEVAGTLAESVGLSPSALSQHLAKMRAEGLVSFRRDNQTIRYFISDRRVADLFVTLHRLYCSNNAS